MTDEGPVLDLDAEELPVVRAEHGRLREVRVRAWVVALVASAVAVASVGLTHAWDGDRARRAREAAVSLAVTVGPGAGLRGGGGMVGGFKFDTTVQVLNGGPLPVTVEAVLPPSAR